jgi:hypothetical protein
MVERSCNRHICETIELARQLVILADDGERDCEDDSCRVLYGVVRDSAYKIRQLAEQERDRHLASGKWEPAATGS